MKNLFVQFETLKIVRISRGMRSGLGRLVLGGVLVTLLACSEQPPPPVETARAIRTF